MLLAVWAYLALGPQGSAGAAFAVTVLLSGIVSYPALLVVSGDMGVGASLAAAQVVVIVLPLITWLIIGTVSGAAGDLLRSFTRWFD